MNTYVISFASKDLLSFAIENGPWSVMGYCMNLKA